MIPVFPALYTCWMYDLCKPAQSVITIVALGNINMGDDVIGIVLVESIKQKLSNDIDVQFWHTKDALTMASELLEMSTPIVIVDCADMGIGAGEFRCYEQSQCLLSQHDNSVSTHGFGFSDALALAKVLGFKQDLFFFTVQALQILPGNKISKVLENNIDMLSSALLAYIQKISLTIN